MKPIVPARVIGGSILVEATPIAMEATRVYRGVDLGARIDEVASGPRPGASSRGPYREAPAVSLSLAPVPVIVREVNLFLGDDPVIQSLFEQSTLARHRMKGSPTPRLLHTFGRGDRILALAEEYVCGTRLEDVLQALRSSGQQMPVAVALAIAQGLLPLWIIAASASPLIKLFVDPTTVRIDASGRVRVLPEYGEERARQAVGAALLLLHAPVSYIAPEQIMGAEPVPESAMFTLGLLLYEMIAGGHPVASEQSTMFEILSGLANHDVPPLRERRSGVHPAVTELVHRCLARDPQKRFPSFRELSRALAAVQALFPPTGPAEIAGYLAELVPAHFPAELPPVAALDAWRNLPGSGYHSVPLPRAVRSHEPTRPAARQVPVLDPDAVYAGTDARPMYAATAALLVDVRPVTRDEMERFFIATRTPRPASFGALSAVTDDDPCTLIPIETAEAYARWAGKRLPTEADWDAAVATLGAERLGTGEVWEWTATAHKSGGHVVRGGRWRDQPSTPPRPENRSFAVSPAGDVGFRCVADTRSTAEAEA